MKQEIREQRTRIHDMARNHIGLRTKSSQLAAVHGLLSSWRELYGLPLAQELHNAMVACMNVNQMADQHLAIVRRDATSEAQIWRTEQTGEEVQVECNREKEDEEERQRLEEERKAEEEA